MAHHGGALVRLVADAPVVADRDPAPRADLTQPHFVVGVWVEVIAMPLDDEVSRGEDGRELIAEVAIGEEDEAQAARS